MNNWHTVERVVKQICTSYEQDWRYVVGNRKKAMDATMRMKVRGLIYYTLCEIMNEVVVADIMGKSSETVRQYYLIGQSFAMKTPTAMATTRSLIYHTQCK